LSVDGSDTILRLREMREFVEIDENIFSYKMYLYKYIYYDYTTG